MGRDWTDIAKDEDATGPIFGLGTLFFHVQ